MKVDLTCSLLLSESSPLPLFSIYLEEPQPTPWIVTTRSISEAQRVTSHCPDGVVTPKAQQRCVLLATCWRNRRTTREVKRQLAKKRPENSPEYEIRDDKIFYNRRLAS